MRLSAVNAFSRLPFIFLFSVRFETLREGKGDYLGNWPPKAAELLKTGLLLAIRSGPRGGGRGRPIFCLRRFFLNPLG